MVLTLALSSVPLSIGRVIALTNSISTEALLLPPAIGAEVTAQLRPATTLGPGRHGPPLLRHSWIYPLRGQSQL